MDKLRNKLHMNSRTPIFIVLIILLLATALLSSTLTPNKPTQIKNLAQTDLSLIEEKLSNEPIPPIPEQFDLNPNTILLGEKLFHDKNLSTDQTVSCASCHDLNKGGTDRKTVSTGIQDRLGTLNSPTVFNAGFNFAQFWNGRAKDLQTQAVGPLFNPIEMGNKSWNSILDYLNSSTEYQHLFEKAYGLPIETNHLLDALADFQKSLITPNSRFDKYLKGETDALNTIELEGYELFKSRGCISCHQGINMGGNMYQKAGIFENITNDSSDIWNGRFEVTKKESDKGLFKVPTLRNIAITAPYFHDGSAKTLAEAVDIMGQAQLGTQLTEAEIQKIVAFLESLTGEYKKQPL